jgi:cell division septation protein DedD
MAKAIPPNVMANNLSISKESKMTDNSKPIETTEVVAKTVVDDMNERRTFATAQEAIEYLVECSTKFVDFDSYPIVAPGLSQDPKSGELVLDPEIYTSDMRIAVATVEQRIAAGNTVVKAIMVYPAPTIESIMSDTAGMAWLQERADIALNAAAARPLRKKDVNPNDPLVVASMPITLADYVTKTTGVSSTLMEAFEANWKDVKTVLSASIRPFARANLSKKEFMRGMQSASYAARAYAPLENYVDGSAFVFAIQCFIGLGEAAKADVSLYKTWLANRDSFEIEDGDNGEEGETKPVTMDALFAKLAKPAEPPVADAAQNEAFTSDVETSDLDAEEDVIEENEETGEIQNVE